MTQKLSERDGALLEVHVSSEQADAKSAWRWELHSQAPDTVTRYDTSSLIGSIRVGGL